MASKRDLGRAKNVMRMDRGDSGQQLKKQVTIVILRCSSCSSCSKYTTIVVLLHIYLDFRVAMWNCVRLPISCILQAAI